MNIFENKIRYMAGEMTKAEYIGRMHRCHTWLFGYADFIKDTDIARIEITDDLVTVTSRSASIKMLADRHDMRIAPFEILNFGAYEKAETNMMLRFLDSGSTVFDIGANIGWHTLNIAKLVKDARVYAFEPIPSTFSNLKRNVEINGLQNVVLHNFGFSNQKRTQVFYYYPEGSGNASAADLGTSTNTKKIPCDIRTLDGFVNEINMSIDFIKCDVEGAELFVFQGGVETLEKQRPAIFSELLRKWSAKFYYHPNEVIQLLGHLGYKCYIIRDDYLIEFLEMNENTLETNFIFLHPEKHSNKIAALVRSC